jgi:uncharacterized protein YycO
MMTNFDLWKSKLTIADFVAINNNCEVCPLAYLCNSDDALIDTAQDFPLAHCEKELTDWAYTEVGEFSDIDFLNRVNGGIFNEG